MLLRHSICIVIFTVSGLAAAAQQHAISISAEVPVQFAAGYHYRFAKHFSVNLSAGVLTKPNSDIIIDVLEAFGTDEQIVLMINNAFRFGLVGEVGGYYHFGKNYTGLFFQVVDLQAADTPTSIVEDYFGTSINNYPSKRGKQPSNPVYLTLKSTLYQGGLLYGRNFPLKGRYSMFAELGISANLFSKSKLSTDSRDLSQLSRAADEELGGYYKDYAFVPSLTIGVLYRLSAKQR